MPQNELKRYDIIFTCLASRAVHLEVANAMDTDSFIQALRMFIARRGNMRMLRSDNGSNFVRFKLNYQKPLKKWTPFLQAHGSDWIKWKHNPLAASHMVASGKDKLDLPGMLLLPLQKHMEKA